MSLIKIILLHLCLLHTFVVNSQEDVCGTSFFTRKRCSGTKIFYKKEDCLAENCCWDDYGPPVARCYKKRKTESGYGLLDFSPTPAATSGGVLSVGGEPGKPGSKVTLKCNFLRFCKSNNIYVDTRSECMRRGCCWRSGVCYQQNYHILQLRNECPPGFKNPPACNVEDCIFDDLATVTSRDLTDEIIPTKEKSYVGFVIDNTGSMYDEITAVKIWLTNCATGLYPDCSVPPTGGWILSPFNDPGVGPKVGPTTNLLQITTAISGLSATGGGDCPELAMQGILDALIDVPIANSGCKIFFFSDATAKDHALISQVTAQIILKGCAFTPVLSGCCGTCQDPCLSLPSSYCASNVVDSRSESDEIEKEELVEGSPERKKRSVSSTSTEGETLLYDLAYKSGGKIILTGKTTSDKMVGLLETAVKIVSCPTDKIAGPLPNGFTKDRCQSTKSCWDGTKLKCFCQNETNCPRC